MKIVMLQSLGISAATLASLQQPFLNLGHEFVAYEDAADDATLQARVRDADVLVVANMPLSGEVIAAAEKLKFISVAFTGFDHIDLEQCKKQGIKVSNAAGYSTRSVAELAFGLMIGLLRSLVPLDGIARQGGTKQGYRQSDLSGKTLGVLGTGAIGAAVAELGLAFGCKVIAYNRSEKLELVQKGVQYLPLESVLQQSDIVTLHTPLTDDTKHLINAERLRLMKPTSILINTAVGPVVDNVALAKALHEGVIAGAGLDRTDMEPPIPADYPLLGAPNTLIIPHVGYATDEALERRAEITFNNIRQWQQGAQENTVL
ncbi:MAG: hydroxyacid dehydrogenase [Gammaproteobacteria bacterium]|nr:hydroxyacid dehydrogenase [Gammaproteobacteria bacterium]